MAQEKIVDNEMVGVARRPDFKGDGVAVWTHTDKNGKPYLAIKILNSLTVRAFSPKEEDKRAA